MTGLVFLAGVGVGVAAMLLVVLLMAGRTLRNVGPYGHAQDR